MLFKDASKNAMILKLIDPDARTDSSQDVKDILAGFLNDIEEKLLYPVVNSVERDVIRDLSELFDKMHFYLDHDDGELVLKFESDQNHGMIDFHHQVMTLYELIVGKPREGETEVICSFYYLKPMVVALEGLLDKVKNTKTWSNWHHPKDEQPLTFNERTSA